MCASGCVPSDRKREREKMGGVHGDERHYKQQAE